MDLVSLDHADCSFDLSNNQTLFDDCDENSLFPDDNNENSVLEQLDFRGRPTFFTTDDNHNEGQFKLPPRLAARLYKKSAPPPTRTLETSAMEILKNRDQNARSQPSVIRRETIVLRPKKAPKEFLQPRMNFDSVSEENEPKEIQHPQPPNLAGTEEQDAKYMTWINSVIATSFKIENITVDTARIINDCIMSENNSSATTSKKNQNVPLKDGVSSIAYREEKLMEFLRNKALQLYESPEVVLAKEMLTEDLKVPRYYIRKDKSIHADVGAKKHILEILLNYNPLWLKVALETIFGTKITKTGKNEVHTLVQFLTHRLLSFKDWAVKKNCKNVTTYFMNENHVTLAKRHILFHYLMIVHFLDVAKRKRLIDHDPCLFRTTAECKSSRDIVISFSRDYITGVGDIIKSLRNAGIHLEYSQHPIEEFDFRVPNLSGSLRCGVRLARLAEIILMRNDILCKLYFPPQNLTRKIHNMELVFKLMGPILGDLVKTVTPREICMGNRPKTYMLLDRIMEEYTIRQREIELMQSIQSIIKIQRTWRRILDCRREREYFLLLRAAVILVQRSFRRKLEANKIRNEFVELRRAAIVMQRRFRAQKSMKKQRAEYQKILTGLKSLQNYCRSYLLAKKQREEFLLLRKMAIFVQQSFRLKLKMRKDREAFLKKRNAAVKIQRFYRTRMQRKRFSEMQQAAKTIQRRFRAHRLAKIEREKYIRMKNAAIIIQRTWRHYRRQKELARAAFIVQRRFRANLAMKKCRAEFIQMQQSAIIIQKAYRSHVETKDCRCRYLQMKRSAIIIQKVWRGYRQRKRYEELRKNVIVVQRRFRAICLMKAQRDHYAQLKKVTVFVQRRFRQNRLFKTDRQNYLLLRKSTIVIQRAYLTVLQRRSFLELRQACITVQIRFRAKLQARIERERYIMLKSSVISIQRKWRQIQRIRKLTKAALVIQRRFRANREMRRCRSEYQKTRLAALILQRRFRARQIGCEQRNRFVQMRQAAITIQRFYRQYKRANKFQDVVIAYVKKANESANIIQKLWRGYKVRQELDSKWPNFMIIREGLRQANQTATEDKKLINVIRKAIERISRVQSIDSLHYDVEKLEKGTSLSPAICEILFEQESWFVRKLLSALQACNRSEPHKKIIGNILKIFVDLLIRTSSRILYRSAEMLEILMKMLRYFPKSATIVVPTLQILSFLLKDKATLKMLNQDQYSKSTLESFLKKNMPPSKSKGVPARAIWRQGSASSLDRIPVRVNNVVKSLPLLSNELFQLLT